MVRSLGVTESIDPGDRVRRLRDELAKNPDDRMLIMDGDVALPGQRTTAVIRAELDAAEQELEVRQERFRAELADRLRRERQATDTARAGLPKIARDAADAERRFRAAVMELNRLLAPIGEMLAARQSFTAAGDRLEAALRQIGEPADVVFENEEVPRDHADAARRAMGDLPPLDPQNLPHRRLVAAVLDAFPDPLHRDRPRLRAM
jgi:seryl-tRNA synthetase